LAKSAQIELVAVLRVSSYDETACDLRSSELAIGGTVQGSKRARSSRTVRHSRRSQLAKVFQGAGTLVAVVRGTDNEYTSLESVVPASVQLMDHATAESLSACLSAMWKDVVIPAGVLTIDVNTHDRASSNLKMENHLFRTRTATQERSSSGHLYIASSQRRSNAGEFLCFPTVWILESNRFGAHF
jgi:hypothetical protein